MIVENRVEHTMGIYGNRGGSRVILSESDADKNALLETQSMLRDGTKGERRDEPRGVLHCRSRMRSADRACSPSIA